MASILFYTSIKTRVKDQESLMTEFVRAGHKVYFVNQQPNEYLPRACESAGVFYQTITYEGPRISHFATLFHLYRLISFVYRHKIDVVYSHLEPANFIAVLAQYFLRARVVVVRHHLDLAARLGFGKDLSYKMTYALAKDVIAVSKQAKLYMSKFENVDASKIHHIDLGYDFKVFGNADEHEVSRIRAMHRGLILVSVGRFDECKRFDLSIDVCKRILREGRDCTLFLLGAGPVEGMLKAQVESEGLTNHVKFLGYVDNVLDYLAAADWLLHPSISESSCVVVKEAGLVNLPVIVCKGIGDFDDYLIDKKNAILVSSDNFVTDAIDSIKLLEGATESRLGLGRALGSVVRSRFDIKKQLRYYDQFHVK